MERFAFILHPLTAKDFARKFPIAKKCSDGFLEGIMKHIPPIKVSHITGLRSPYAQGEGWFVACPLTSRQMLDLPEQYVLNKIIKAGRMAEKLGAKIVGLGAFSSIVGDAGVTIAKNLNIAVTTGNSYTVATALEGTREAAKVMGVELERANVLILGATGSIGAACAQILAQEIRFLTLAARNEAKLEKIAEQILRTTGLAVRVTANTKAAIKAADIIIAVTSAVDSIIEPEDLKPGAIVCDVSRPRNVSRSVAQMRNDVLVIEGGVVEVPGDISFGLNFGFPEGTAYACMAETMILALEQRYENFTIGRNLTVKQIETITQLAKKHGFKLAGLRSFECALTYEEISSIKNNAMIAMEAKCRSIS
ncbi:saccharopine dehydrogenase NADP-binding domain-containing protein|uniref:Predicted amino acid dehydrogenase n=1 Tax=Dendrosporobacter quercicolus TaxID=146817 RepID=A0A1G9V176_9FIRM|nr:saccharopine dehydrogenase NADP-binding domain-containing protein [Dendrosporobacter quercicolus]NSL47956.1 saccharopine dehydrogenase NADP-binding domain-containing protein [Dendrosporobacter quercicolus DSM 1736]SDM65974.1 Predicted amino acid dehydrogenase [Dendrosporobacter quercicolus]